MAQQRLLRIPGSLLKGASELDSRAKENRRRNQGTIVGLDKMGRTARVDVGFYNKNGLPVYLENVSYPAQLNPSIGDIVSLDYPHTSPGSVRITTTGLAGSNSTGTISSNIAVDLDATPIGSEGTLNFQTAAPFGWAVTNNTGASRVDVALAFTPEPLLNTVLFSDVSAGSVSRGALIVGQGSSTKWAVLALGASGTVLTSNGTDAVWSSAGPISVDHNGTLVGTQSTLNFIDAAPFSTTVTNNSGSSRVDITVGFANQSANTVLAGPSSGGAAAPTFRALVLGDLPASGTNGQVYRQVGGAIVLDEDTKPITLSIDGQGSAIAAGWTSAPVYIPRGRTIQSVTLCADQSGSIVVDIWKTAYPTVPTSSASSICASDLPTLSSAQVNQDTALTSWNTTINDGDLLVFHVNSASSITRLSLVLKTRKN